MSALRGNANAVNGASDAKFGIDPFEEDEYTPTTDRVENGFSMYRLNADNADTGREEFARWLAAHDAKVLRDAADALPHLEGTQITRQQGAAHWLRGRADSLEQRR